MCMNLLVMALTSCQVIRPASSIPSSALTNEPMVSTTTMAAQNGTASPIITPTVVVENTPLPLAARVNGDAILLAQYQAELNRYQAAVAVAKGEASTGTPSSPPTGSPSTGSGDGEQIVLDDLIAQVLLTQAAQEKGLSLDDATLQNRFDQLVAEAGGRAVFDDWMAAQGYDEVSFRRDLARSLAAARMRDQILASVPDTAEQVHARQILLYNLDQAKEALAQLQNGKDFATLARELDPVTAGDLDWFPRGYLTSSALEDVAFRLAVNQYSEIIQTPIGYHILQVIAHEPQRPLTASMKQALQARALQDWLTQRRSQSQIEILLPH